MDNFMQQARNLVFEAETKLKDAREQLDKELTKVEPKLPTHVGGVFQNKPELEQTYSYISDTGAAMSYRYTNDPFDNECFTIGNCYVCEEAAEWYVEQRKVETEALRAGVPSVFVDRYKGVTANKSEYECLKDAVGQDRLKYLHPWSEGE